MARTVSLKFLKAINAQETDELPVLLLTITHPDLVDGPERLCSSGYRIQQEPLLYGMYSRGLRYLALPFSAVLPDDKEDSAPVAKLSMDNVDRDLVALLRSTTTPAEITMEVVLASSPDDVEIEFPPFDLVNADYDDATITISLAIDALATEPYPSGTFDPASFPGLF